ncbi:MAG: sugar phosphate isomerase/epimerase [Spirochaetia bacterium]|jgi:sugar phosphate isomerase/epimerase|nr:sugar phosphate isomerase/epimerase [Spirochaetia bacterium]
MELLFFCPRWGSEQLAFGDFCTKAKGAGYAGVEMNLPTGEQDRTDGILDTLARHSLSFIGQHHQTHAADRVEHRKELQAHLRWLASARPLFINSQTGRDWFPFEDNLALIGAAQAVAEETGVTILHETHRGKFSFCAAATKPFLDRLADLRLSADFSHWCTVSESLLEDQEAAVSAAIEWTDHIHARVGHAEGPQVNDPRAPEWHTAFDAHLAWWDRIIQKHRERGTKTFTITTESGPFPYMPTLPWTGMPVASQWDINCYMMDFLRRRYA